MVLILWKFSAPQKFLIDERRELGHAAYTIALLYGAALEERKELF